MERSRCSLILKKVAPRRPRLLTLISILSVSSKLYAAVPLAMVGDSVEDLSRYLFVFRRKWQAAEPVFIISQLLEKANELQQHIIILDGDLPKAYDNVLHTLAANRLVNEVSLSGMSRPY